MANSMEVDMIGVPEGHGHRWARCALGAALLVAGCSPTGPGPDDPNVIANGGFEIGTGGAQDWFPTILQRTSEYVTFAVDSVYTRSGRRSAMIHIHEDHPSDEGVIFYNWFQRLTDGFEPGRSYQLDIWVRTSAVLRWASVWIQSYDADGTRIGWDWVQPAGPDTAEQWRRASMFVTIPEGTVQIYIRAGLDAPANTGGTVWFDDVSLVPVGGSAP